MQKKRKNNRQKAGVGGSGLASSFFSFQVLQRVDTFPWKLLIFTDKLIISVSVTQLYENRVGTEDVL